jgi:sec-independent protein translocase protein TatB
MEERAACALLRSRFEAAGFKILENRELDEDGVRLELDGFDPDRRVGYEYVTEEAGDGWDVDPDVIAKLAERKQRGELFVLIVDEHDAPDADSLGAAADAFLEELRANLPDKPKKAAASRPAKKPAPKKKPAAKKPAARKPAAKKKR